MRARRVKNGAASSSIKPLTRRSVDGGGAACAFSSSFAQSQRKIEQRKKSIENATGGSKIRHGRTVVIGD